MSITSLYKHKGPKSNLSSDRGIFNVNKVRSIFDQVIYSDVYDVGGRKHRNIRDHLFVV